MNKHMWVLKYTTTTPNEELFYVYKKRKDARDIAKYLRLLDNVVKTSIHKYVPEPICSMPRFPDDL